MRAPRTPATPVRALRMRGATGRGLRRAIGLGLLAIGPAWGGMLAPPRPLPEAGAADALTDVEGGRVLAQALQPDNGAGQRRLDLLLDLQRHAVAHAPAGDGPVGAALGGRPAAAASAAPLAAAAGQSAALGLLREALQADDAGVPYGAPASPPADEALAARRGPDGVAPDAARQAGADEGLVRGLLQWLRSLGEAVREHLAWLLAGLVGLALVAGVMRLADRRV